MCKERIRNPDRRLIKAMIGGNVGCQQISVEDLENVKDGLEAYVENADDLEMCRIQDPDSVYEGLSLQEHKVCYGLL